MTNYLINSIIEAISISLNAEFGDNYKIYTDELKQGLEGPCFFIFCINPTNRLYLGKRYFRENQFAVQYYPESELNKNSEFNSVSERFFDCLEYITVDDSLVRGTKMHCESTDEILSFFVNYDMFMYKLTDKINMEDIEIGTEVKE